MTEELAAVFAEAGCRGQICVQLDDPVDEVALLGDEEVVSASVFKVLVALAAETAFVTGTLDPVQRVRLSSTDRTPGPTGFSLFDDDVEVSTRDLVPAMLTVSDNAATDALLHRLGVETCNALAEELGLRRTVIVSNLASMISSIAADAGFAGWDAFTAWQARTDTSPAERATLDRRVRSCRALSPATATRTTPREMCTLLRAIWLDQAGPPAACRRLRALMSAQVSRNRLASAFPPPARVAAKSGSLLGVVRNEIGVVQQPDGRRVYAAVFTQAGPTTDESRVNMAIGRAVATAVDRLAR